MPRTKIDESAKSEALKEAEAKVKEIKQKEVTENKRKVAQEILNQYESEYDEAKDIFFKVNGARRTLKALEA